MEIAIDKRNAERQMHEAPNQVTLGTMRALNRSIASGRTVMARSVAQDIGAKVGDVRERIQLYEATPSRLVARMATGLRPRLPLIDLRARGPEPSRGKGRGVSYRIGQQARRLPHAFIATMRSGHRGVFMRDAAERLTITERFGPSLGRVFLRFVKDVKARTVEMFNKNLIAELRHRLRRK